MKKSNKIFKNSKLFISLTSVVSVLFFGTTIVTSIALNKSNVFSNNSNLNSNDVSSKTDSNTSDDANNIDKNNNDVKPLILNETNYFNPRLSSKNGPILFWKEEIISADWFGAERWKINVSQLKDENGIGLFSDNVGSWNRKWLNFDLDKKKDILYILSNGGTNKEQVVVAIDVASRKHIKTYKTKTKTSGNNDRYFGLSVLENGNVLVYCKQGHVNTKSDLINTKTGEVVQNNGNLANISNKPTKGFKYLMNLIPIGNNRNLAMTYNFTSKPSTTGDAGKDDEFTSQVEFILCDDNMNYIENADSTWKKPKLVTPPITGTRNSAIWPQRDWYKLLDGRVVTVIYDKLVIIDGSNENNPSFTTYELEKDKWIESWSFDTNEKLYFKAKDSSIIQTVTLDPLKGNNHFKSTYYDLENSNEQIKKYANNFTLFNVYGYSGQIMLVNPYFNKYINAYKDADYPTQDQMKNFQYGLAAAITSNKSNVGQGDTKGLLNTKDAFQKSADFTIKNEILNSKLPSEITRNDLDLLNQSFYTQRTEIESGELKYKPFVKTKMDDKTKELEVTVNLDQIPWFVTNNVMPNDIKPLTLRKTFKSNIELSSRFTWKNSDTDDYDFKNMLPTKVEKSDIERISPLVSTLTSKSSTIEGVKYPKTDYEITSRNDNDGKIKITATYKYLPMDTLEKKENIKEYKTEKEFTIFKSSDINKFSFVSENGGQQDTSNIDNVPALKDLKEANLFPSHFKNASKQEFLRFININETKGYPLEKMNISVEANDDNGTLKVIVDPTSYDSNLKKEIITYTGLNKKSLYSFSFKENVENFNKKQYRPSDINNEILFKHFINYSGFDSSDLSISFTPNDNNGNLIVDVSLNVNYPDSVLTSNGFKNVNRVYKQTQNISGFKTNNEFNNEYQLEFKSDLDSSLVKIKELTPATIQANINNNSLTVENKTYKNIYELVNLFVSSRGSNIPEIKESDKSNIEVNMFTNNSGGEITFKITFKSLPDYANPITFIQKFTGFAKGNDDITNDVLTFKDSNQLKILEKDLLDKKPSEVKSMFENKNSKKEMLNKFLSGAPTGDYKKAIDAEKFELELVDDDNFGTLTINIKFKREDITNPKSLLEYSQTFTGFNYFN